MCLGGPKSKKAGGPDSRQAKPRTRPGKPQMAEKSKAPRAPLPPHRKTAGGQTSPASPASSARGAYHGGEPDLISPISPLGKSTSQLPNNTKDAARRQENGSWSSNRKQPANGKTTTQPRPKAVHGPVSVPVDDFKITQQYDQLYHEIRNWASQFLRSTTKSSSRKPLPRELQQQTQRVVLITSDPQ